MNLDGAACRPVESPITSASLNRIEAYRQRILARQSFGKAVLANLSTIDGATNWSAAVHDQVQFRNALLQRGTELNAHAAQRQQNMVVPSQTAAAIEGFGQGLQTSGKVAVNGTWHVVAR